MVAVVHPRKIMSVDITPGLVTMAFWDEKRPEITNWLIRKKGFSAKAAELCVKNFIETQIFVADCVGLPQLGTFPDQRIP
jgi:hypothetical protein